MVRRGLLALWLLFGCGDDAPEAPATPSAPSTTDETQLVALAPRPPAKVELTNPGTQPRQIYVLAPKPGTTDHMSITLSSTMHGRSGGQALPTIATPPLSLRGRMVVDDVREGAIVARQLVDEVTIGTDPDAPDLLVQQLTAAKPAFESYRATLTLDPRGGLREGSVQVPTDAGEAVVQLMRQLTDSFVQAQVPLPTEAIGKGAEWTAVTRVDQAQMALRQEVKYRLEAIEGASLKLHASIEQSLLDTHVAVPGMPGTKAKIELFRSTGAATIDLDPAHLVPTSSRMELEVQMVMEVAGAQQELGLELLATIRRTPGPRPK